VSGNLERIAWDEKAPGRAARKRALEALEAGELVALPTETVYGVAARADTGDAVERLRAMKGREASQALTWHVGDRNALARFGRVSPLALRLAKRYWPGPLTLVLHGVPPGLERASADGWTGVRFPAHSATAQLLDKAPFPVVASSANLAGQPPLNDPDEIAAELGAHLAVLLDGGRARLGESSAVLKVGPGHFELLRPGLVEPEQLRATAGLRIGFVCTGNTCRSPMAEGLARDLVARRLEIPPDRTHEFGFEFLSMGVLGGSGAPPSEHAIDTLADMGIDISGHRSRPAVPQEIRSLDHVFALTTSHLDSLRLLLPPGATRNCELLDPAGGSVPDPIGGPRADYERAAKTIREAIEARLDDWV
jgi:tRNA threonylcarbamoyl adenosine modification protein (Sua5/YciO/YrdC/YwlC family)